MKTIGVRDVVYALRRLEIILPLPTTHTDIVRGVDCYYDLTRNFQMVTLGEKDALVINMHII